MAHYIKALCFINSASSPFFHLSVLHTTTTMDACDAGCGKYADLRCSGCKSARYCGAECQKKAWKTHETACKSLASTTSAGTTPQAHSKPRTTHCTGCKLRFGGLIGEVNEICPDCGYAACDDCICHNRRGTCFCEDSNFGHNYCGRVPEWYHYGARTGKLYRGDNHPEESDAKSHGIPASQWETEPRKCRNCGEEKICLIPGYTCNNWLCQ
ncbi:hypothetical protein C8R44DRAFT_807453 [Mycena epipterygia]|nr:hypothetical protein C8R44DRAFT_807453 [Mycena epipterygia]